MKRVFLLCLTTLFTITMWAYDFSSNGIYYNIISETEVEVTYNNLYFTYSGKVSIPDQVTNTNDGNTYTVTRIGESTFDSCSITEISLPNTLTSIGSEAFYYSSLPAIELPESLVSIGSYAFCCSRITSVVIPSAVETIEEGAFAQCTVLTKIEVDEDNRYFSSEDGVLYSKDMKTLVQCPSAFEKFDSWEIPVTVTTIGVSAFYFCMDMKKIVIPDSITYIDEAAFYYCPDLTEVSIGNSVEYIGGQAFAFCSLVKEMTVPNSVTYIGSYAFEYCEKMEKITLGNSVETISNGAFQDCKALKTIAIPSSVTTIRECAFSDCSLDELDFYCRLDSYEEIFNEIASCKVIYAHADQVSIIQDEWSAPTILPFGELSIVDVYPCSVALEIGTDDGVDRREVQSLKVGDVEANLNDEGLYVAVGLVPNTSYDCILYFTFDGNSLTIETTATTSELWKEVITLDITAYTASFQVGIYEDGYYNPDEFGLCYGETYYACDEDGVVNITNLRPESEYTFTLYAKYGDDILLGDDVTITTLEGVYVPELTFDPKDGSTMSELSEFTVICEDGLGFNEKNPITMTRDDEELDIYVNAWEIKNGTKTTIDFSTDEWGEYPTTLTTAGTYIITIPAKFFILGDDNDKVESEEIILTYIVEGSEDEGEPDGISAVNIGTMNIESTYSANGQRLNALQKGFNIVRMNDGTTKKILIK